MKKSFFAIAFLMLMTICFSPPPIYAHTTYAKKAPVAVKYSPPNAMVVVTTAANDNQAAKIKTDTKSNLLVPWVSSNVNDEAATGTITTAKPNLVVPLNEKSNINFSATRQGDITTDDPGHTYS